MSSFGIDLGGGGGSIFTGSNLTELSPVQWWNKLVESCYLMEKYFFGRNVFKMKAGERME
jgi:hypothetical protein